MSSLPPPPTLQASLIPAGALPVRPATSPTMLADATEGRHPPQGPGTGGMRPNTTGGNGDAQSGEDEKIYVSKDWYFIVDPVTAHVKGEYFEGSLGSILQIRNSSSGELDIRAVKIPRLRADTRLDNAFTASLMEEEVRHVREVHQRVVANGDDRGCLLRGRDIGVEPLRGQRMLRDHEGGEHPQNDSVLFVSFPKNKAPRIIAVVATASSVQVFPVSETTRAFAEQLKQNWARMRTVSARFMKPTIIEVFKEKLQISSLDDVVADDVAGAPPSASASNQAGVQLAHPSEVWYCSLPSIDFQWAAGTLEWALRNGSLSKWSIAAYYQLLERICTGIGALHGTARANTKGIIHGDLRPANIMVLGAPGSGDEAARDPKKYHVGDYGSFANEVARGLVPGKTGGTEIAPGFRGHRHSTHYSIERRGAQDRETANCAIIVQKVIGDKDRVLHVLIGWSDTLLGKGDPKSLLLGQKAVKISNESSQLASGDRVRVADYILHVREVEMIDSDPSRNEAVLMLVCECPFARVFNERVPVLCFPTDVYTFELDRPTTLKIPSYSEIWQLSEATDVYGVGTIALYSVLMGSYMASHIERSREGQGVDFREREFRAAERRFEAMIHRLTDPEVFLEVWPDLSKFFEELREAFLARNAASHRQRDEAREARASFNRFLESKRPELIALVQAFCNYSEIEHILTVFNRWRTLPNSDLPMDHEAASPEGTGTKEAPIPELYHIGHFLLFMHFVLCCLHRQDDPSTKGANLERLDQLFCCCRRAGNGDHGCAGEKGHNKKSIQMVLERLTDLKRWLECVDFEVLLVSENELTPGTARTFRTPQLLRERMASQATIAAFEARSRSLEDEVVQWKSAADKLLTQVSGLSWIDRILDWGGCVTRLRKSTTLRSLPP